MAEAEGGSEDGAAGAGLKPAEGGAALLIIDMINRMDFEGAEALREGAAEAAGAVLRLRDEAECGRPLGLGVAGLVRTLRAEVGRTLAT